MFRSNYEINALDTLEDTPTLDLSEEEVMEEEINPCIYSTWKPWSPCSTKCGSGTMNRNRTFIQGCIQGGAVEP